MSCVIMRRAGGKRFQNAILCDLASSSSSHFSLKIGKVAYSNILYM